MLNAQYRVIGLDGSHIDGILISQDSLNIILRNFHGNQIKIFRPLIKTIKNDSGIIVYRAVEKPEEDELLYTGTQPLDSTEVCTINLNGGNTLVDVRIIDSDDSTFTIGKSNFQRTFKISGINSIEFEKHNFWSGFLYGTLATLVFTEGLALVLSWNVHGEGGWGVAMLAIGGLIICTPVGVITGVISEFFSGNTSYDFTNINYFAKANRLKYLRGKYRR